MMKRAKAKTTGLLSLGLLILSSVGATEQVKIPVKGGTLHGTLEVPKGSMPCPLAVIIAGSGPTDRDGNNPMTGKNNSLKYLAEALSSEGIASLRYDKRGIAQSAKTMTKEEDLRFETYIDDAVQCAKKMRDDDRFTKIIFIGHSEGSLIGMVACQKAGGDAFVSIAGTGLPASELILKQLEPKLPEKLFSDSKAVIAKLIQGQQVEKFPPMLASLFRKSVQPYLISWFRYDPAKEVAKLKVPVLIIQGTTDLQVGVEDANLLTKANPAAKKVIVTGMNHVLKKVEGNLQQQLPSYGDPSLPVVKEMVDEIVMFLKFLN